MRSIVNLDKHVALELTDHAGLTADRLMREFMSNFPSLLMLLSRAVFSHRINMTGVTLYSLSLIYIRMLTFTD